MKISELDLFKNSNIPIKDLPKFYPRVNHFGDKRRGSQYKWHLAYRKLIRFNPKCKSLVPRLFGLAPKIKKLKDLVYGVVSICTQILTIGIFISIIENSLMCCGKMTIKIMLSFIRILLNSTLVAAVFAIWRIGVDFDGLFKDLGDESCSDNFTNLYFFGFEHYIDKYTISGPKRVVIWMGAAILYEFCWNLFWLK
jgi:hypothetical protein